jgi:TorA maturation chaperone TorD
MSFENTVQALLADGARAAECQAARAAWVKEAMAAWEKAQREMDRRCDEAVGQVSEEEFNRLFEAEQAKVCALLDQLRAAADHDQWPKHLYFGGI